MGTNKRPVDDEVLIIDIVSVNDDEVMLNIRLRGDKNWMYFNGIPLTAGKSIVIIDEQRDDIVPAEINVFEKLPR